jgi:DNA-binding XRE family transcriptional regulator
MTGRHVRKLREALGLTTAEMGELLAVTHQTIYRWEACTGALPPIGLAQRTLLLLIGMPEAGSKDAERIAKAVRTGGRLSAWAYLTRSLPKGPGPSVEVIHEQRVDMAAHRARQARR